MPANEAIYRRVFATGRIRSNKLTVRSRTCFSSLPFVALTVVRSAVYRGQRGSSTPLLSIAGRNNASYVKSSSAVGSALVRVGSQCMPLRSPDGKSAPKRKT